MKTKYKTLFGHDYDSVSSSQNAHYHKRAEHNDSVEALLALQGNQDDPNIDGEQFMRMSLHTLGSDGG